MQPVHQGERDAPDRMPLHQLVLIIATSTCLTGGFLSTAGSRPVPAGPRSLASRLRS